VLLFGYALYQIIGPTPYEWRIVFGSVAIPAIIGILLRAKVPESPRWLAKRGRIDEAIEVIKKLTGQTVTAEEIRQAADHLVGRGRTLASQILEVFTKRAFVTLIVPLIIADFAFDLIPGAQATLNPYIYTLLGIKAATALLMSALFIGVQVISTLIVALTVEKIGRVKLMLVGGLIESLAALAVAFVYHYILLTLAFVLIASSFSLVALTLTHNYAGELFPTVVRGGSAGLVTTADRAASAIGTYIAPILLNLGGVPMLFIVIGIIGIIGFIFALVGVAPKGKIEGMSVDEIETKLFGT
jgi:putative MFS transporter